jgi:hypothetical protein
LLIIYSFQLAAERTWDVSWSLAVATTGKLTKPKPKLESVTFVEIVWD